MAKVFLGIDYGSKRIGLSHADELGFAFALPAATAPELAERFNQIAHEISRLRVTQIVLGYPLSVEGERTKRCDEVDAFALELARRFQLPIEKIDEALTSLAADEMGGRKPRSTQERQDQARSGERDSRAAIVLLQDYLNSRGIGTNLA
ncbi:MAG: Holliday junction resolvase RuvX [Verrucomicrobiota bacterium]